MLVAIVHYSKWCETRLMKNHDVVTTIQILEEVDMQIWCAQVYLH
jgi:hypothetical protein